MTCTCERQDCTADPSPGSRRKPLVQITIGAWLDRVAGGIFLALGLRLLVVH